MEETVLSLLQNPGVLEQTAVDIMKAYKVAAVQTRSCQGPTETRLNSLTLLSSG